jgi:guanosine-3',5'-bis(diphosphate) 3'-pyrophosphohydrolase
MSEFAELFDALEFAAVRHHDQRRKGDRGAPYVNHLIEVGRLIAQVGAIDDAATLIAAVLHDTLEDTETTPDELERRFGAHVRRIVEEVSDDPTLPKSERKRLQIEHAPTLSEPAKLIKVADKISNVREIAYAPPAGWSLERRRDYVAWADAVVAGCRGVNAALERRYDEIADASRGVLERAAG